MDKDKVMENAISYVKALFSQEGSGHDYYHMIRVMNTASRIAREENADEFIVKLAALLHDVDDIKLFPQTHEGHLHAVGFLRDNGMGKETIARIIHIIEQVSFKGTDSEVPDSIEGMCVQDADRLDAIGAIGIARAFAYGGHHDRPLYDPDIPPQPDMDEKEYRGRKSHTINHFHEKLFLLKSMLNTVSAQKMAEKRDLFMRNFVEEFLQEWNGVS